MSVVVATRDREARLAALLRSLREQTLDPTRFEVVVVDDGSRDGAAELLRAEAADSALALRVIHNDRPYGPAAARNVGWRAARGSLVAFTDDDCEADPAWLEACLRAAELNPGAIIQGRTEPNPRELHRLGAFSHSRKVDGTGPWWFETCNIAYPREVLEAIGGFDKAFPEALGEDTDLGWRALAVGSRREFVHRAVVHHAVEDLGIVDHLRGALRGSDSVLVFRRHPPLRAAALGAGVVRNPSHLRLLVAVAGLILFRRPLPRALTAYPYFRLLGWRCRQVNAGRRFIPYLVLYDLLTLYTTIRGDLRHRVLVL